MKHPISNGCALVVFPRETVISDSSDQKHIGARLTHKNSARKKLVNAKPVTEFQSDFIARTKQARNQARLTRKQVCKALNDMDRDTYKNYETIRLLPHVYIPTFCLVCNVSADWLYGVERGRATTELWAAVSDEEGHSPC